MGYYFDLVFPQTVTMQEDVLERLRVAGVQKWPPEPDPHYPEPVPGDPRLLSWHGTRVSYHILTVSAKAQRPGFWVSIRTSWATGEQIVDVMLDLLDLAGKVEAQLYDGQVDQFVTTETVTEVATKFHVAVSRIGGLFGAVRRHGRGDQGGPDPH